MTDSLNLTGRVSLSTESAESSLDRLGSKSGQMAVNMQQAGERAGKALDQIGDIAKSQEVKFTRAESSIVTAIKKVTVEAAKGARAIEGIGNIEFNIAAKGLDPAKFAPFLDITKRVAEESRLAATAITGSVVPAINNMGMSAKATTAALRQVPAQFTDIIVSLQGGQAPLTVLLQQGGQLKDVFGGVGNAARALGGYVAGLVSPFTILAAAVGGVALAYFQGSKEADAYNKALILSGNAAGTTAAQMNQFSASVSGVVGTQAAAAEALAMFAATGRVAGDNLAYFSEVALRLEKTAGVAVDETVKKFAELGKAPVEASKKLNEETNYLTQAVYEQIKALTDQGRAAEAVSLAQNTYADAMKARSTQIAQNIGVIEKAWNGAKSEAKAAWDAFLGIGRPKPVTALYSQLDFARASGAGDDDPTIMNLQKQIAIIEKRDKLSAESAKQEALRAAAQKAGIDASDALGKANEKALSKQEQMNKALKEYRDNIAAVKAVNPNSILLDAATISKAEAAIREQFKGSAAPKGPAPEASEAAKLYAKSIEEFGKAAQKSQADIDNLTASQAKLSALLVNPVFQSMPEAWRQTALQAAYAAIAVEQAADANAANAKALKEVEVERAKELDSYVKSAKSANDKAQALEDEVAMYGKTKAAIAELTVARLKEEKAKQMSYGDDKAVQALDDEIAALRRVAVARDALDSKEASTKAAEETTKAWKKTADDIERALTDSLMRGFESGKDMVSSLRDYIVNAFKTTVVKIAVQPIMGAVTGLLGGASPAASAASSLGGGGILSGIGGLAGQFGSGFSGSASAASALMGGAELTTAAKLGSLVGAAAPFIAGALAIKGLADAMKYTVDDKGGAFVAQANSMGASSVALRRDFQQNGGLFGGGTTQNSEWADADASIRGYFDTSIAATTASVKKYAEALGLAPEAVDSFKQQIEVSITGLNPEQQQAAINKAIGGFVDEMVTSAYGGALAAVAKAGETSGQTLERLAVSLGYINTTVDALGRALMPIGIEGAKAASALVDVFGGLEKAQAAFGSYYENFYSVDERAANTRGSIASALNAAGGNFTAEYIGSLTREAFRGIVDATDSGSPLFAALIQVSGAFASVTPDLRNATSAVSTFAESIKTLSNTKFDLTNQLLGLQGQSGLVAQRIRDNDLGKLTGGITDANQIAQITASYDENVELQRAIDQMKAAQQAQADSARSAAQAQTDAANAAKAVRDAWQSVTDSLFEEVRRIRGMTGGGAESFAQAQANFSITAVQASAGDQAAAKALPELSRVLLQLADNNATSIQQLRLIQGQTAGTLETIGTQFVNQFGLNLPKLSTGTNYVPKDMAAILHAGEAVVPAAYNPANGGSSNNDALLAEIQALRSEVAALRTINQEGNVNTKKTADTLVRVTRNGEVMLTEVV